MDFKFSPKAFVEFEHFPSYYAEILDDLEAFFAITKYPVLEVVISLLHDMSCQYIDLSKETYSLLKRWKINFDKQKK